MNQSEQKLFILDLLKLQKVTKINDEPYYSEEAVIQIIKNVLISEPTLPSDEVNLLKESSNKIWDVCRLIESEATIDDDVSGGYLPEPTQDEIEEEEWHEIHDDINESKRNGEIEQGMKKKECNICTSIHIAFLCKDCKLCDDIEGAKAHRDGKIKHKTK